MSQTVDAMGKQCPIPVVMARQALQGMQTPDTLVVLVDNEVAVQNLTKLAGSCHLPVRAEKLGGKRFEVTMDVAAPVTPEPDAEVCLPPFITQLTGITDEQLAREGVDDRTAAEGFCRLLEGAERPLLVAYNEQFDLNFIYHLLRPLNLVSVLKKPRFLDALTVYRDRRDYPHKLCNAIEAYGLTEAENSHRAVDDARATVLLLEAMAAERDDLTQYIDLFGVHPKYGVSGRKIASVTYCPQPYDRRVPLYELAHTM